VSELHGIKLFAHWPQIDDKLFSSLRHASDRYELFEERPALQAYGGTHVSCARRFSVSSVNCTHEQIFLGNDYLNTGDSSC